MNARIWKINVSVGDLIKPATIMLVLEAMKMELPVVAPNGHACYRVTAVLRDVGDVVESSDILFHLRHDE